MEIIACLDGSNYIILAAGTSEEISEVYEVVREFNSGRDIRRIKLDKEKYEANKGTLMLLNEYIKSCDKGGIGD